MTPPRRVKNRPASGRPRERSLTVWADDRVGDARDIVVLHVLADAAQLMREPHADPAEKLGIANPEGAAAFPARICWQHGSESIMSHHLDGPIARQDVRLDITDLYAFRGETGTVFVVNVCHSIAGAPPSGGTEITTCRKSKRSFERRWGYWSLPSSMATAEQPTLSVRSGIN